MLKNLKSLFIIEEENQPDSVNKSSEDKTKSSDSKESKPTPQVKQQAQVKGDVKISERLLQAIEKTNLDGFDYLEFKKSLQALSKITSDEATCYKSAFLTASTMGVTLEKLQETVQFYLKVLKTEEDEFLNAIEIQKKEKVSKKDEEFKMLNKLIAEKNAQIVKLNEEISEHKKKAEDIMDSIKNASLIIDETKDSFLASYNALKSQILDDSQKMNQYLK